MFNRFNFDIAGLLPSDADSLPPACSGLFVSPERTVETDGHQIVVVTVPESQPTLFEQPDGLEEAQFFTPFLMDRDSAMKLAKMFPKRNPDAPENSMALLDVHTEAESESTLALTEDVRRALFKSVKLDAAKFPNPELVIPDKDSARYEISFNADVLVPVLRAFQKFAGEGSEGAPITIRLFGPERGIRIDAESCDGQKMTAVVMPRRMVEGEINSNPA